jgi:hypothetical protein
LELAGWYQTVPYLRLRSHTRWHIAIWKLFAKELKPLGNLWEEKQYYRMDDVSMMVIGLCLVKNA